MSTALAALKIGFVGAGRVAQTLAPAFDRANLNVVEGVEGSKARMPDSRLRAAYS